MSRSKHQATKLCGGNMEMGSSSLGVSEGSGANECSSSNGLKFRKNIYLEDVDGGAKPAVPAKKGRGTGQGGGGPQHQPPRCQVEGCSADLTGAKAYYCRHKVCGMHSKSPKVVVNGMEQRFCQQCSRFHLLHQFDQRKRSCRKRLAGHNERRRKPQPGPLSSRCGYFVPPFDDDGARFGGFLMDFAYPRQLGGAKEAWLDEHSLTNPWQGALVPSSRTPTQSVAPYERGSAVASHFANHDVHSNPCFQCSDSSFALCLLSNKPWATASSRAPMISTNACEGAQMAQSIGVASFMSSPWSFKGPGTSGGMHEIPPGTDLGLAGEPSNKQFSGELELPLQGSRECSSSSNLVHWSL